MATRTPIAVPLFMPATAQVWTNQPAAAELPFRNRTRFDLTDYDVARVVAEVTTGGIAGAQIGVQFSTDNGATWNGTPVAPLLTFGISTGVLAGSVGSIPAAARGDVLLRVGGLNGNGVASPAFGNIYLQLAKDPTFEAAGLWQQLRDEIYRLANNMRDNAADYKAALLAPRNIDPAAVGVVMLADANAFEVRLARLSAMVTNSAAASTVALRYGGYTVADLTGFRDTIQGVIDHTQAATLTTAAQVNAEADFIAANVPNFLRLY